MNRTLVSNYQLESLTELYFLSHDFLDHQHAANNLATGETRRT
jgi:hypothetical protein